MQRSLYPPAWRLLSLLAVFSLLSSAACTRQTIVPLGVCPDYKIGILLAQGSGEGDEQRAGYDFALASSRILGCPITAIYKDEGVITDRETAQIAALDLANQGVLAIVGATSDQATMRAAGIIKFLEIPLIVPLEVSNKIAQDTNPWVFRISPPQTNYADQVFSMLSTKLGSTARIAILFEKTESGEAAAVIAGQAALNHDLRIISYVGFEPGAIDKPALMRDLQGLTNLPANSPPPPSPNALLIISSQPTQALDLWLYFKENVLGLRYIIGSGYGFTSTSFLYDTSGNLNADLNGLILTSAWNNDLPWDGLAQFSTNYVAFRQSQGLGAIPASARVVQSYVAVALLIDILNGLQPGPASLADLPALRDKIAHAFADLNGSNHIDGLMGPITFQPNGQSNADAIIIQIINDQTLTVFPAALAGENEVLPSR